MPDQGTGDGRRNGAALGVTPLGAIGEQRARASRRRPGIAGAREDEQGRHDEGDRSDGTESEHQASRKQ